MPLKRDWRHRLLSWLVTVSRHGKHPSLSVIRYLMRYRPADRNTSDISSLVLHRAFTMMWCHYSPEWFDSSFNFPNCAVRVLDSAIPGWDGGGVFGGFKRSVAVAAAVSCHRTLSPFPSTFTRRFLDIHARKFRNLLV